MSCRGLYVISLILDSQTGGRSEDSGHSAIRKYEDSLKHVVELNHVFIERCS